jgi:hypothetical protein
MGETSFFPDLQEIFRMGVQEILPVSEWPEVFDVDEPSEDRFLSISQKCELMFGAETSNGIFLRSGWAGFKFFIRFHGKTAGIDNLEFRLQPPRQRLMDGLYRVTKLLQSWNTDVFHIDQTGDDVTLTISSIRKNVTPVQARIGQHFFAGLYQEYLYWAGGGKQYPFEVKPLGEEPAVRVRFRLLPVE